MRKVRLLMVAAVLAVIVSGGQAPASEMSCGVANVTLNRVVCDTVFRGVTGLLPGLCDSKAHICLG